MPTARELLEQAEALMRRNRIAMMAESAPAIDESAASGRSVKAALSPALDMPATPATLDDIPLLTDAVEDFDSPSIPHPHVIEDESSVWNDAVDEDLRLGVPNNGWKQEIAADDGAAGKMGPQVRDDRLHLG